MELLIVAPGSLVIEDDQHVAVILLIDPNDATVREWFRGEVVAEPRAVAGSPLPGVPRTALIKLGESQPRRSESVGHREDGRHHVDNVRRTLTRWCRTRNPIATATHRMHNSTNTFSPSSGSIGWSLSAGSVRRPWSA